MTYDPSKFDELKPELAQWETLINRVRIGGAIAVTFRAYVDPALWKIRVEARAEVPSRDGDGRMATVVAHWPARGETERERLEFLRWFAKDLYSHELDEQFQLTTYTPAEYPWSTTTRPFDPHRTKESK